MLDKLYNAGYLQIEKLIIDNTLGLGLSPNEAVVLIQLIKEHSVTGNINPENLQKKLLMATDEIDKVIVSLMERSFYEIYISYDNGIGKECASFKPLFDKLEAIFNEEVQPDSYDISKACDYISAKLKRVLVASELEILQSLIMDDHYSYEQIVAAVDDITKNKRVLSMRTLTQNLANKKVQVSPKKEAPKSLMDFYNKI